MQPHVPYVTLADTPVGHDDPMRQSILIGASMHVRLMFHILFLSYPSQISYLSHCLVESRPGLSDCLAQGSPRRVALPFRHFLVLSEIEVISINKLNTRSP